MKNIDLMFSKRQTELLRPGINKRFAKVLESSQFIMGEEVSELEQLLARYYGAQYAIACANGTDALTLALMALDLNSGDVVFTPSYTYVATAEAISILNGRPYFVDVGRDFNISPESLKSSIVDARKRGLKIRGIISVDLFGQPVDYEEIRNIAKEDNLFFISDAAQAFGATFKGVGAGEFADITTTSFFPTKPLGCYGDGGMVFTSDWDYADKLRSLSLHGKGDNKYHHVKVGMNSRLDTIQAAVLLEKFKYFPNELKGRNQLASFYNRELEGLIETPKIPDHKTSTWGIYQLLHDKRDDIINEFKSAGISSNIYYPIPLHKQPAYSECERAKNLTNSEFFSSRVFCLPMHAYIEKNESEYIVGILKEIITKL